MERTSSFSHFNAHNGANELKEYRINLKRFFSRRVKSQWEVDDLVQESMTRFFVVSGKDQIQQPFGYLYRIAHNLLIDRARRDANAPSSLGTSDEGIQVGVRAEQEDGLHLADLHAALEKALDELPAKCREAFILRRFHNMDTPAIADRLNVSHRMVQKYLIRSMDHLHERLKA